MKLIKSHLPLTSIWGRVWVDLRITEVSSTAIHPLSWTREDCAIGYSWGKPE